MWLDWSRHGQSHPVLARPTMRTFSFSRVIGQIKNTSDVFFSFFSQFNKQNFKLSMKMCSHPVILQDSLIINISVSKQSMF